MRRLAKVQTPIPGVDEREAKSLSRLGVKSLEELLFWFPRWHVNKARISHFAGAAERERAFFLAKILRRDVFTRGRLHIIKITLDDGTGRALLYWFNRPYLISEFKPEQTVLIFDRPERAGSGLRFSGAAGTCEVLSEEEVGKIAAGDTVVFYRTTTVIGQARAREIAGAALASGLKALEDPVPESVRVTRGLLGIRESVSQAHRPSGWTEWERARRRIVFDQLFLLQAAFALSKAAAAKIRKKRSYSLDGPKFGKLISALPFSLTGAQKRAIEEIKFDLARENPMNRLLQGDVGSGKTVVAAAAVAIASDSGYQSAVMAPTEILADQHFHTFRRLMAPAGIRVGRLVSGIPKAERKQIASGLDSGYFDLLVGTHALIEPDVRIPKLGFAVIDERHKFGVRQRSALERKGEHVDLLMMTATPLPRALVLTQYGDTMLSVLDEMPPGRGGIKTVWSHGALQRQAAYNFVKERMTAGERAYAVFPLVSESEHLALRDATREYERLKKVFSDFSVGLIHGRMNSDEKDAAMRAFSNGEISLLVSTTVIEVGIDVPQATVMLVEHANRFGLAQLHQLRGRVGRGSRPSFCFLVTGGPLTADARERLEALVRTMNGFELAEQDLRLRGPGELFGTRQHGASDWEHLDLLLDVGELEAAREEVESLLARDASLSTADGKRVRRALSERLSESWGLARAS